MTDQGQSKPLDQRTCVDMMIAGTLGPDGGHPRCLGPSCNKYEICLAAIHVAVAEMWDLYDKRQARQEVEDNAKSR